MQRRHFIKNSGLLLTGAAFFKQNLSSIIPVAPSDQLNIGVIGINGMGWSNLQHALQCPGVRVVAICDVDENVLNRRRAELDGMHKDNSSVKLYKDYRHMLDNKDVDVVIIGTPDHWHALQTVHACQAGKDVYVEKPAGNSIGECGAMIEAKNKYGRKVQVGQWQRSQEHMQEAISFVHSGKLGKIRTVKLWCYQGWMKPDEIKPDTAPPPGVDYDLWLGPARKKPFNSARFHFNFRWFWDYAGGLMTDWGVHLMDLAVWGMKESDPVSVSALGGKFAYPDRAQETPDTLAALYQFEKFNLLWDHAMGIDNGLFKKDHGIAFIGDNGTLQIDRSGWEVMEEDKGNPPVTVERKSATGNPLRDHLQNLFDAIRNNNEKILRCSIDEAAQVAKVCQLGNIAYRSGKKLNWDAKSGKFTENKVNQEYLMAKYNNGYELKV